MVNSNSNDEISKVKNAFNLNNILTWFLCCFCALLCILVLEGLSCNSADWQQIYQVCFLFFFFSRLAELDLTEMWHLYESILINENIILPELDFTVLIKKSHCQNYPKFY